MLRDDAEVFTELLRYVGWNDADVETLRRLAPVLAPHFEAFARHFYDAIVRHPRAAAVLTEGPEQVGRLQCTLIEWMRRGLAGPHDAAFVAGRARIGQRHVAIGLPQELMFAAMALLRRDYHDVVLAAIDDRAELAAALASIDRLLDVELAIMLRHYQLHSEARLVQREREIQVEKLTAMQTLTAGLAHETRNPLNAAKLQLEVLQRRLARTDDDGHLLETAALVGHEIERVNKLLSEFLAFARPAQLATRRHDVADIVRGVVEREQALAHQHGAALELAPGPAVYADVDAAKIFQVVMNLVRNAIEAVPPGGHVSVAVTDGDGQARVRVKDDGPGIPEALQARIYEPFFTTKAEGTGMGMAIVHTLVRLHGGSIELASELGHGAEFTVTLPG